MKLNERRIEGGRIVTLNRRQLRALTILAEQDRPLHGGRLAYLMGEHGWRGGHNTLEALARRGLARWIPVMGAQQPSSVYEITAAGRAVLTGGEASGAGD